jgi:hypothetical protein
MAWFSICPVENSLLEIVGNGRNQMEGHDLVLVQNDGPFISQHPTGSPAENAVPPPKESIFGQAEMMIPIA